MKTIKYIFTTLLFLVIELSLMAQPRPPAPSTPGGDYKVPVEGYLIILIVTMVRLGILKLRKNKSNRS